MANHYKIWTTEEKETLRKRLAQGKTNAQIAKKMGRTVKSIYARSIKLRDEAQEAQEAEQPKRKSFLDWLLGS